MSGAFLFREDEQLKQSKGKRSIVLFRNVSQERTWLLHGHEKRKMPVLHVTGRVTVGSQILAANLLIFCFTKSTLFHIF